MLVSCERSNFNQQYSSNTGNGTIGDTETMSYETTDSYLSEEDSSFLYNRLQTGNIVYKNQSISQVKNSIIKVKTGRDKDIDFVIIIKQGDRIVRNAYVRSGDTKSFSLPSGTYQVFFYSGQGWNPNKTMSDTIKGGFVLNEAFSKDEPVYLNSNELTYELTPRVNGNFQTEASNKQEIF